MPPILEIGDARFDSLGLDGGISVVVAWLIVSQQVRGRYPYVTPGRIAQ